MSKAGRGRRTAEKRVDARQQRQVFAVTQRIVAETARQQREQAMAELEDKMDPDPDDTSPGYKPFDSLQDRWWNGRQWQDTYMDAAAVAALEQVSETQKA